MEIHIYMRIYGNSVIFMRNYGNSGIFFGNCGNSVIIRRYFVTSTSRYATDINFFMKEKWKYKFAKL